jgi:two-component system, sensor histidine kinase and response regulator
MSINPSPKVDRILIVDDSPDNLFLVQATLGESGYEISLAEDGKTALAKVNELLPDLILLDVMMPGMDGYEVTKRIRQNKDLPYIPILLITAHERSSVVRGLDMGADDFIRKPLDVDELLARVRSLLRLKHSIDEREHMIRQREDFVSRLTHDLRTPLVAADRVLTLFQNEAFGAVSSDMHEALDSMLRSNKNLLLMVNTLLEVYRHEAGCKTLTLSPCDLKEIIHDVVQELKPLADERELALTTVVTDLDREHQLDDKEMQYPFTTTVIGDRLELHRVLTNLVGNAIKFTDKGSVTIRLIGVRLEDLSSQSKSSNRFVVIEIKDTGAGILAKDQATLFERFRQGEHKRSGSGLGLYLSRRIIESHQGTIQVQSELDQGSVFTIRLPA